MKKKEYQKPAMRVVSTISKMTTITPMAIGTSTVRISPSTSMSVLASLSDQSRHLLSK